MYILRIEHPVADFDGWKKAFDSDPVGRKESGVKSYRIMRPVDNPRYVMIDLLFDTVKEAETLLARLRTLWERVRGEVLPEEPRTCIVEVSANVNL